MFGDFSAPVAVTVQEAARLLGCSANTVRAMCRANKLPEFCTCFRVGEGGKRWRVVFDYARMKGGPTV